MTIKQASAPDGATISFSVTESRRDNAPRFALIHSLAMDHQFWDAVIDRLGDDYSFLAVDARGHGASDKPSGPYTVELMARDVLAAVDAVQWDRVYVAGASMGGCVALQFAAQHAERTLGACLIDTTAWYGASAPSDWAARAERASSQGLSSLTDFQKTRWFSDAFRSHYPDIVQRCVDTFLRNDVGAFMSTCEMLGNFDGRDLMGRLRCPTAIIVGEEDYAAPVAMAEALHRGIEGSTLQVVQGARHLTPLETPDVVADAFRATVAAAAKNRV